MLVAVIFYKRMLLLDCHFSCLLKGGETPLLALLSIMSIMLNLPCSDKVIILLPPWVSGLF